MNKSKEYQIALDNLDKIELGNYDRPNQRISLINRVKQYIDNSYKENISLQNENELYIKGLAILFEILGLEVGDNIIYILNKNQSCFEVDLYGSEYEILKEIEDKINELKKVKN